MYLGATKLYHISSHPALASRCNTANVTPFGEGTGATDGLHDMHAAHRLLHLAIAQNSLGAPEADVASVHGAGWQLGKVGGGLDTLPAASRTSCALSPATRPHGRRLRVLPDRLAQRNGLRVPNARARHTRRELVPRAHKDRLAPMLQTYCSCYVHTYSVLHWSVCLGLPLNTVRRNWLGTHSHQ